jgi:hypothetical protein
VPPEVQDDPLAQLAGSMAAASSDSVDPSAFATAMKILRYRVTRISPALAAEADDIVADAVAKFLARARAGGLESGHHSSVYAAYLLKVLTHTTYDYLRARSRRPEILTANAEIVDKSVTDDEVASVLSRKATAARIYAALKAVRLCGDVTCFRIVTYKLDQIHLTGKVPSNRETASASGISHTAVAGALRRFKKLLADVDTDEE